MKQIVRHSLTAAAFWAAATAVHAQTADLRYRMPMPSSVTFTSFDTIATTMSGMPMGDMSTNGHIRTLTRLVFAAAGDSIEVTATLLELEGMTETPMGNMPLSAGSTPPMTMHIGATGPDQERLATSAPAPTPGAAPGDILGAARVVGSLLALPGRELRVGETWTDTTTMAPEIEGMQIDMTVVLQGTYVGDTIVDGVNLNVLRMEGAMTSTMDGSASGMKMAQRMTSKTEERILWNSALHYPVRREATAVTEVETDMTEQNMKVSMTSRTRSITIAEPGN